MAESEVPIYPRGQLSFGAGDLVQVTNVSGNFTNNAQLRHTLKYSPSGKTLGNKELSGSFVAIIDEDGAERDYFSRVASGEEVNMRLKVPQLTKSIVGCLQSIDFELPLDDAIQYTVSWIGKFVD